MSRNQANLITQLENIYLKDIITKRYKLHFDENIGELLDVIASGISSLTNPKKLANTFKTVKQSSISKYYDRKIYRTHGRYIYAQTGKRFGMKRKRYIDMPYKIYFEDIALRNAYLNFRQIEPMHIMENIIYNELRYRDYQIGCRYG